MRITEIQRFCMHDGPGIRTTVFLKGCTIRCLWCHNPEAQKHDREIMFYKNKCILCGACEAACPNACQIFFEPGGYPGEHADFSNDPDVTIKKELHVLERKYCTACGKCAEVCPTGALVLDSRDMTVEEVFAEVLSDSAFYEGGGGITLSGGEPFMQEDETLQLLKLCKANGVNTVVETSGFFDPALVPKLAGLVDLLLWDYKLGDDQLGDDQLGDDQELLFFTGARQRTDVDNLKACDALGIKSRLRLVLIKGVNDDCARIEGAAKLFKSLSNCEGAEILPYHPYGGAKEEALGRNVSVNEALVPSAEDLKLFAEKLEKKGVRVVA